MRNRTFLPALLLAVSCSLATAQVNFNLQVTHASCSSNGKIKVTAFGGSGIYTYQLTGNCLDNPVLQQTPVFNNLAPCQYTVEVMDGVSGATATQTATVGGNYQSPQLSLFCGSCAIETQVTGGKYPFAYAISTTGLDGPFQNNSPLWNPVFSNILPDSVYWIRVTDACGNIAVEACQSGADNIKGFGYETGPDGKIHVTSVNGGNSPFTYTIQSTTGIFSNYSGVFPPTQWGCDMKIIIADGCTEYSKTVTVKPKPGSFCTNFAEGTASVGTIVNGVPPYTFICYTPGGTFTSSTNELTGLPLNSEYYQFQIVDTCGNYSDHFFKQIKYPIFKQDPVTCGSTSISLFTNDGGCVGGFDADSWPVDVTCLSCSPVQSGTVTGASDVLTFEGNNPGEWKLAVEDGCGDHMVCHDTIVLMLTPMCDSLEAELTDRFICNNNTASDRPMLNGDAFFVLKNQTGIVVDSNLTGRFHIPEAGEYTVTLNIPGCGIFTATTNTGDALTVNPEMYTYITNAVIGGSCTSVYQLIIDPKAGPYTLTGGPQNISILVDESFLIGTCRWYSVSGLLPGQYELSPLSHCGIKNINLPAPDFNLQATPAGNCPGSGTITVTGGKDLAWWQDWGIANNGAINWPGGLIDRYSLDVNNNGSNSALSGSPYIFGNVLPGPHTVYLYTFNSGCPIDTVEIIVPEAEPLKIDASSGILCDGEDSTSLVLEMLGGKPPFIIEQLDCENLGKVVATYTTSTYELGIPGVTLGDYCFRVLDSCVISLDHQFSVQYYQDEVDIFYNCDNTITFHVDSINASYKWITPDGAVIGNSHQLTLPNNSPGEVLTVLVNIGTCVISRSVTMPEVKIVPSVSVIGEPYFCEGDTVLLTAISDADTFVWNTGASQNPMLPAAEAGVYSVTVTNDFGCTATAEFQLQLDQPGVDIAVLTGGNGFGLNCFRDSNGVLLAQPSAGFAPFIFEWSNLSPAQKITALPAGEYSVTITDSLGCQGSKTVALTEPDLFVPHISSKRPLCFENEDGRIEIEGWSGGAGVVNASLNGSFPALAPVKFDYLPPGEYLLEVWDGNGCRGDTAFNFPELHELLLELGDDLEIELGDSIRLEPFVNFWPVDSFLWRTNDPAPMDELSVWCAPLENSYYYLKVWDEFGCTVEDKISVKVDQTRRVFVPNAFSPNGDGVNDFFTIYVRTGAVRSIRNFQVFSRWGEKVFSREEFQPNNDQLGWNGTLDGRYTPPGVFAWKAEIEFVDGRVEVMSGDVMVVR